MIEAILISKKTGRIIKSSYTPRQLLDTNEDELVEEMSRCDCESIGETNVIECHCEEEFYDYTLIIGEE